MELTDLALNNTTETLERDLRRLLLSLSSAFATKGYNVKPFRENNWQLFRSFPIEKKKEVYANVSIYAEIYLPILSLPGSPNEDGRLLWSAMRRHGLRPCGDFFSQVGEGDIVEFYSGTGQQVFHNINFFDVCSYTFLEIFSYPFTELWIRDEAAFGEAKQALFNGFTGKWRQTVDADISRQYLIEAFSEDRYIIEADFTKFSPMYSSDGSIAVLACVSKGRVVDEGEYGQILLQKPHLPRPRRPFALV